MNVLRNRYGVDEERISLPEWLARLEEKSKLDFEAQKPFVALGFSDFLRSMGNGREDLTSLSENAARVSPLEMVPLSEDLLASWLEEWEF